MRTTIFSSLFLVLFGFSAAAQAIRNFKQEAYLLRNMLSAKHVSPRPFDNQFSGEVFDEIMRQLDPEQLYFTQADIDWLTPYRLLIDDEINGGNWIFLNRLKERYKTCLERADRSITTIQQNSLNWNTNEYFNPADTAWARDVQGLSNKQRLWVKKEVLERLGRLHERDSGKTADFFKHYESDVLKKVIAARQRAIRQVLNNPMGYENIVGMIYFHAITAVFDPHTLYLSDTDVRYFMAELSSEKYYFGFSLEEDHMGDIIISALAPGGPAWKSGELHVSDKVLFVKFSNQEAIDVSEMAMEELSDLLDVPGNNELELTIRTSDGLQKNVSLRKEKLETEQDVVKSFVLNGQSKIGYIYLPDFYTRWDDGSEGARCANDVAKEILKLKKDGIEGLILDVRFNGGGSLYEAMAMAGIFIDAGPLGLMQSREQNALTLKDMNRGTVYDGPLVLMVNGRSASASEFLAAALQDYHRALIVGSRTYGKGTGQHILPLDPNQNSLKTTILAGGGFIKITTERMYRVTGKSVQGRGVTPDIHLPDIFTTLDIHEDDTEFALPADSIVKKTYYTPLPAPDITSLRIRSTERVAASPAFRDLRKTFDGLAKEIGEEKSPVLLTWQSFQNGVRRRQQQQDIIRKAYGEPTSLYRVSNNSTEAQRVSSDAYSRQLNLDWSKKLETDLYLEETFQILLDYINLNKKP